MIFSNKGMTQISGSPIICAVDLANIIRSFQHTTAQNGGDLDFANELIVFAGRFAMLDPKEQKEFLRNIPQGSSSQDVLDMFESAYGEM